MNAPRSRTAARLDEKGFTIRLPFWTDDYNANIATVPPGRVTLLPAGRRALLIGNTREAWPHFLTTWHRDASLRSCEHPFDLWVERTLRRIMSNLETQAEWHWGHSPAGKRPSLLHAATAAGLTTGPAWLAAHPEYGPWFALRVALVPADPQVAADLASQQTINSPCQRCAEHPCHTELQRLRSRTPADIAETGDLSPQWRAWVRVRDVCPVGRAWRYDHQQLEYHYTKRRELLTGSPDQAV